MGNHYIEIQEKASSGNDRVKRQLDHIVNQVLLFTNNKSLADAVKTLSDEISKADKSAPMITRSFRKDLDRYDISETHALMLRKSLRYLEALVTPAEELQKINDRKQHIAESVANEIIKKEGNREIFWAIVLDGSVSQKIAVEDSDIDIALVVGEDFGQNEQTEPISRFSMAAKKMEDSLCSGLNELDFGARVYGNDHKDDDNNGVHLRITRVSDLDIGDISGFEPTPRDGLVLWQREGFDMKKIG